MSAALEEKVIKKVVGLSDDNLIFLSDMIDKFMRPVQVETTSKRIGVAEGKFVVPDDFDDCNDEIAGMFGVKQSMNILLDTHIFKLKTLKRDESAPKHNDPFDRIMLAQSKEDDYKFITHDSLIPFYNEPCVINV